MGGNNHANELRFDYKAKEFVWDSWDGPKENEAIFREVMKVFNKVYHYIFPRDTRFKEFTSQTGCSGYYCELERALERIEELMTEPNEPIEYEIILFYY